MVRALRQRTIDMMKVHLLALCALASLVSPAKAWVHGAPFIAEIQSSIGISDLPNAFMNYAKNAGFNVAPAPPITDYNGYPSGLLASNYGGAIFIPANDNGQTWVLKWTGTGAFNINAGVSNVVNTAGGCATTPLGVGTNCRYTFTFTVNPGNMSAYFPSGVTYTNMNNLVLCRLSDEAALTAGGIWTPEFISVMQALKPAILRTMGMTNTAVGSNFTGWNYRTPLGTFSWDVPQWNANLWAGTASGTDQYTVGPATDTPVAYTDGESFQATFTNASAIGLSITGAASNGGPNLIRIAASTSTLSNGQNVLVSGVNGTVEANGKWAITVIDGSHFDLQGSTFVHAYTNSGTVNTTTINSNSRGVVFVVPAGIYGSPNIATGKSGTLIYDGILGDFIWTPYGLNAQVPIEALTNLANTLNIPLWYNFGHLTTIPAVTSIVQYFADNLNPALYLEWSNEVWNGQYAEDEVSLQRGLALGWGIGSNQATLSYEGLRIRQVMGAATTAWSAVRSMSQLHRLSMGQAFGDVYQFDNYQFQGQSLNGTSYPLYAAAGFPNYDTNPNRPIDFVDGVGYADYYQGAQSNFESAAQGTLAQLAGIINAGTLYAAGGAANVAAALAFLDNDVRNGAFSGTQATSSASTIAPATVSFTGGIIGNNLTVASVSAGSIYLGTTINCAGCPVGAKVTWQLSGTQYGAGVYYISAAPVATVSPGTSMTGTYGLLTVGGSVTGSFGRQKQLVGTGIASGTSITWEISGGGVAGGAGTYAVDTSQTIGSQEIDAASANGATLYGLTIGSSGPINNIFGNPPIYSVWQAVAAKYGVTVNCYEGGLSMQPPTAGMLTAIGDGNATTDAANIAALMTAYKNNALSYNLVISQNDQFFTNANYKTSSWLTVQGPNEWSLLTGGINPAVPYQTYYGVAAANSGVK